MALTSHHHVHPVRRTLGLVALAAVVVILLIASWGQNRLAERIEASVRVWTEQSEPAAKTP